MLASVSPSSKHQIAYVRSRGNAAILRSDQFRYDVSQKCLGADAWRSTTSVLLPHGIRRNEAGTSDDVGGTTGGLKVLRLSPTHMLCALHSSNRSYYTSNRKEHSFCQVRFSCLLPASLWCASVQMDLIRLYLYQFIRLNEASLSMFWLMYTAHLSL